MNIIAALETGETTPTWSGEDTKSGEGIEEMMRMEEGILGKENKKAEWCFGLLEGYEQSWMAGN